MKNIDNISYLVLLVLIFSALFLESGAMGAIALTFSFLVLFKVIFYKKNTPYHLARYEKAFIIYFLIVTISLFGSTLFMLSLHGYIKTLIYALFFASASIFFKDNRGKIAPTFVFVCFLMTFESVVAILQNMGGVKEISGWQDTSSINPEEIISRAYGTLLPYNPNLLAGYLLTGLSGFIYVVLNALRNKKKKSAIVFLALFMVNITAIILTGCRGAYLGFMLFFPTLLLGLIYYANKRLGGLSNIKKRYKSITIAAIAILIISCTTNPAISKRFESILSFRTDSSISFRLNVYESAINMFKDNPFLGIGIGNQNFREIYGLYMKTGFDALGCYCVPLEMAVESGIFALLAFIIFIALIINKCVIITSRQYEPRDKILAFAIILMLACVFGHGLFDTIWYRPQVQFLFWTNIAMLKSVKKLNLKR